MHHSLSLLLLVLIIVLVLPRGAGRKQKNCCKNTPAPLPAPAAEPAQEQDQSAKKLAADTVSTDKLSQDQREQLRQVLALADDVKTLESQFAAIRSRLPEPPQTGEGDSQTQTRRRQCAIITEQLRIAKSDVSYLITFVMAPYQSFSSGQHIPSFSDASWAFTAGHLSLSFARARIVALS